MIRQFSGLADPANGPMLSMNARRRAAEVRHAREMDEVDRAWTCKIRRFWVRYAIAYGAGLATLGYSFHTNNYEIARTAWELGFFIAIVAPLGVTLDFWYREMR